MNLIDIGTLPAVPDRPVASASDSSSSGQAGQILELMNQLNAGTRPDPQAYREAMTEEPAAKQKRMIGALIAGALGSLATRKTREGGLAGFSAGASGYSTGALTNDQAMRALKLRGLESERENKSKMAAEAIKEIIKNRYPSAEHQSDKVKQFQFKAGGQISPHV